MRAARLVVVGQDDDVEALEPAGVVGVPVAGAIVVAHGDAAESMEVVRVLLAFDDKHGTLTASCNQFGKAIEGRCGDFLRHPEAKTIRLGRVPDPDAVILPGLSVVTVRRDDLELGEQVPTVGAEVVVLADDLAFLATCSIMACSIMACSIVLTAFLLLLLSPLLCVIRPQISSLECADEITPFAARAAYQHDVARVTFADQERGRTVVVRRAATDPAILLLAYTTAKLLGKLLGNILGGQDSGQDGAGCFAAW